MISFLLRCLMIIGTFSLPLEANSTHSSPTMRNLSSAEAPYDQKKISEYLGYFLWKELNDSLHVPYHIEDVIQGIRKAEKGDIQCLKKVDYQQSFMKLEHALYHQKMQDNLQEAEKILSIVKKQKDVLEVIKDKLYIQRLQEGDGNSISSQSKGLFHIKCKTSKGVSILNTYEEGEGSPKLQDLAVALPGFALGVSDMKENETRVIYIHPDLAYGISHDLEPNSLLIVEVMLLRSIIPEGV